MWCNSSLSQFDVVSQSVVLPLPAGDCSEQWPWRKWWWVVGSGGVQHTQHIHNERGMGWRREKRGGTVNRMREIKVKLKGWGGGEQGGGWSEGVWCKVEEEREQQVVQCEGSGGWRNNTWVKSETCIRYKTLTPAISREMEWKRKTKYMSRNLAWCDKRSQETSMTWNTKSKKRVWIKAVKI